MGEAAAATLLVDHAPAAPPPATRSLIHPLTNAAPSGSDLFAQKGLAILHRLDRNINTAKPTK